MKSTTKILIKERVSVDLALRNSADDLFEYLESLPEKEIIIDFVGVKSISRSFAHEYFTKKNQSKKSIIEINVPENVKKMFRVVEQPRDKTLAFDIKSIRAISL